ncbi:hypothetical protein [Sphingomonas bacterium]|uniref:hypothetical protein n=1 Tax=Sphingomonas bacterium TaxID=1895847 RepID=UPI002606AE8A|nr:hypothetical protein [Sphingomonas bacterium]MDB5680140.1 hypothetical protein [Sphingomonas bacterium]
MIRYLLAATLLFVPVAAGAQDTPAPAPTATPAADVKGATKQTAYKVKSIDEEYAIMRKLGLKVEMQSLIMGDDGHPYDMLTGTVPDTGEKREVWFDIKSFYGKEFGF